MAAEDVTAAEAVEAAVAADDDVEIEVEDEPVDVDELLGRLADAEDRVAAVEARLERFVAAVEDACTTEGIDVDVLPNYLLGVVGGWRLAQ